MRSMKIPTQDLEAWRHEGLVALRLGCMEDWRLTLAFCVQTRVAAMIIVFSRHRVCRFSVAFVWLERSTSRGCRSRKSVLLSALRDVVEWTESDRAPLDFAQTSAPSPAPARGRPRVWANPRTTSWTDPIRLRASEASSASDFRGGEGDGVVSSSSRCPSRKTMHEKNEAKKRHEKNNAPASAPHPQEAHEALHEDPPQDLQRQRSIPTGGAAGAP